MRRWIPMLMMSIVGVAGLASCGSDGVGSAPESSLPTVASSEPGSDIEVVEVLDGVEYYGACGNEVLDTAGLVLYPLLPEEVEVLDIAEYPDASATPDPDDTEPADDDPATTGPSGLVMSGVAIDAALAVAPRVAPPGPGDDVGTVVVYSDGIARFESESGTVRWLTRSPRSYNWVC